MLCKIAETPIVRFWSPNVNVVTWEDAEGLCYSTVISDDVFCMILTSPTLGVALQTHHEAVLAEKRRWAYLFN